MLWTECANGLWRIARAVPALDADHAFGLFSTVPVEVAETGLAIQAQALRLGGRLDHPSYDCLYLALALDRGAALATADRRFLRVLRRFAILPPTASSPRRGPRREARPGYRPSAAGSGAPGSPGAGLGIRSSPSPPRSARPRGTSTS